MLGYELRNWLAQSDALVSHKTSPPQSDMVDGRLGFHMPITCEYANSPIWACGCYHRSRAVPIWLTQYWVDMTCNPSASNECDDATSPKNPDKPVMNWCQLHGFLWFVGQCQLQTNCQHWRRVETRLWGGPIRCSGTHGLQLWNSHPPGQWE